MSAPTQAAIKNGDIYKLKEILEAEEKEGMKVLVEQVDPTTFRRQQGILQVLKGIIRILP